MERERKASRAQRAVGTKADTLVQHWPRSALERSTFTIQAVWAVLVSVSDRQSDRYYDTTSVCQCRADLPLVGRNGPGTIQAVWAVLGRICH